MKLDYLKVLKYCFLLQPFFCPNQIFLPLLPCHCFFLFFYCYHNISGFSIKKYIANRETDNSSNTYLAPPGRKDSLGFTICRKTRTVSILAQVLEKRPGNPPVQHFLGGHFDKAMTSLFPAWSWEKTNMPNLTPSSAHQKYCY